jgi:hypothetical protein
MDVKTCKMCDIEKDINEFYKQNGKPISRCKECFILKAKEYKENNKELVKEQKRNNYHKNKDNEVFKLKVKKNREDNKEYQKEYYKKYREDNKEYLDRYKKEYYINNKEKIISNVIKYKNNRKIRDVTFKLTISIRRTINNSIYRNGYKKTSKTYEILGCTFEEFKAHLESKFEDWMNWENKGLYNGELNYGWDIDHIIPVSKGKTEEEVYKLNHFTNLRPLCSKINRDIKRNNLD